MEAAVTALREEIAAKQKMLDEKNEEFKVREKNMRTMNQVCDVRSGALLPHCLQFPITLPDPQG